MIFLSIIRSFGKKNSVVIPIFFRTYMRKVKRLDVMHELERNQIIGIISKLMMFLLFRYTYKKQKHILSITPHHTHTLYF